MWLKKNKKYLLLILVLCLSIGFALLTVDFLVKGNLNVKGFKWDVHFDNVQLSEGSVSGTDVDITNTSSGSTVDFSGHLTGPGDYIEFTVDAVNDGTVNALITDVNKTNLDSVQSRYLIYQVTLDDGTTLERNHVLKKNTTETIKVLVKYRDDIGSTYLPEESTTGLNLNLTINFVQTRLNGDEENFMDELIANLEQDSTKYNIVSQKESGRLTIGDEACFDTECFDVVSVKDNSALLLAKYNLNVGFTVDSTAGAIVDDSLSDPDEPIQDAKYTVIASEDPRYGAVAFSDNQYWTETMKYVYDSTKNTVKMVKYPSSTSYINTGDYSIAYFISKYSKTLDSLEAPYEVIRLMSEPEYVDVTAASNSSFIFNTSFWLGTSTDDVNKVFYVDANRKLVMRGNYRTALHAGARPLIEVELDDINYVK